MLKLVGKKISSILRSNVLHKFKTVCMANFKPQTRGLWQQILKKCHQNFIQIAQDS